MLDWTQKRHTGGGVRTNAFVLFVIAPFAKKTGSIRYRLASVKSKKIAQIWCHKLFSNETIPNLKIPNVKEVRFG